MGLAAFGNVSQGLCESSLALFGPSAFGNISKGFLGLWPLEGLFDLDFFDFDFVFFTFILSALTGQRAALWMTHLALSLLRQVTKGARAAF